MNTNEKPYKKTSLNFEKRAEKNEIWTKYMQTTQMRKMNWSLQQQQQQHTRGKSETSEN